MKKILFAVLAGCLFLFVSCENLFLAFSGNGTVKITLPNNTLTSNGTSRSITDTYSLQIFPFLK